MEKRGQIKIREEEASSAAAPPSPHPHGKGRRAKERRRYILHHRLERIDAKIRAESAVLKAAKKKLKPSSSQDLGEIAQNEDENCDKKPPSAEEEIIKHIPLNNRDLLEKGCLDDAKLPLFMDKSGLSIIHSSSMSGEAQEEATSSAQAEEQKEATSFDEEQTHTLLKVGKKKLKPSSSSCQDLGQGEDEHSDKKPPSAEEEIIKHIPLHNRDLLEKGCLGEAQEEATSSAATPPPPPPGGKGKQHEHHRSEGEDHSPLSGEQAAIRSKRRRKRRKVKQLIHDLESLDALLREESAASEHEPSSQSASSSPDRDLAGSAGEASASPTVGKTKGKRRGSRTRQKKTSPSDSRKEAYVEELKSKYQSKLQVLRDELSSSVSREEQEEATSLDEDQTQTSLKVIKKKLKPSSSQDLREIEQNEDEQHSDKRPLSADFGKIAKDEDEQHHDKFGVHAIEDDKQKQSRVPVYVQALLCENDDAIKEKAIYWLEKQNFDSPQHCDYHQYDEQELMELYEQLALYRIRGYELTVDRKLAELDDATLKLQYPSTVLHDKRYFRHYESSLEWYFDLELCSHADFSNYQRLVLRDCAGYVDWGLYHSTRSTYQEDVAYVQYCEAIAKEIRWIEDYLGDKTLPWRRVEDVAYIQALKIAADLRVPSILVYRGFKEYICGIHVDYANKVFDDVHFEIWKRVAKQKMSFKEALLEIHRGNMFPLRSSQIENELKNKPWRYPIKDKYDAHVACIDKMASEADARQLIRQATTEMVRKSKYYLDYVREKLNIAKDIGLIPKGEWTGEIMANKAGSGQLNKAKWRKEIGLSLV